MNWKTFLVVASLGLGGCADNSPCSASTCAGCCSAQGRCELGQSTLECGSGGAACTLCGVGLECATGVCRPSSVTGSGGGTALGGGTGSTGGGGGGGSSSGGGTGTTGGGIGTTQQELISGTRLRAIHYAGPDGTRAPAGLWGGLFWDTQKQFYCVPTQFVPPVCAPIAANGAVPLTDGGQAFSAFGDAACLVPIVAGRSSIWQGHAANLSRAGLPALETTHWLHGEDAGARVTRGATYTGPVYGRNFSGTCALVGETTGFVVRDTGVAEPDLALLPLVRD